MAPDTVDKPFRLSEADELEYLAIHAIFKKI